jgi:hypothetical protein
LLFRFRPHFVALSMAATEVSSRVLCVGMNSLSVVSAAAAATTSAVAAVPLLVLLASCLLLQRQLHALDYRYRLELDSVTNGVEFCLCRTHAYICVYTSCKY